MAERWEKYTIANRNGVALDPTSSPHLSTLKATPCTSVFEESFFGAVSDQWKLMGRPAAPWRVSATAINRANASIDLLEEDVPQVIHWAARVEEMHGKCVKNFLIQLAKRRMTSCRLRGRKKKPHGPNIKHSHKLHTQRKRATAKQPRPAPKKRERAWITHTAHQAKRGVIATEAQAIVGGGAHLGELNASAQGGVESRPIATQVR